MATGRFPVQAPPAEPPAYGLIQALGVQSTIPFSVWGNGISYAPEGCQVGQTFDKCDVPAFVTPTKPETVEWNAYVLSIEEACSTFSGTDENVGRAIRLMQQDTERQLGFEFWTGTLAQASTEPGSGDPWPNAYLASLDSDDLSEDGPKALVHAMACLDDYLCDNNGGAPGAIHCTCQTFVHWKHQQVITERNGRYYSPNGHLVIMSAGYNGSTPSGDPATDDNVWAYATDLPRVFLSPIQTPNILELTDRRENTVIAQSQRMGLVEWQQCRHAGIQLAQKVCGMGGS